MYIQDLPVELEHDDLITIMLRQQIGISLEPIHMDIGVSPTLYEPHPPWLDKGFLLLGQLKYGVPLQAYYCVVQESTISLAKYCKTYFKMEPPCGLQSPTLHIVNTNLSSKLLKMSYKNCESATTLLVVNQKKVIKFVHKASIPNWKLNHFSK